MGLREKLIAAGVKNLKAYGYPCVTAENILTDEIYKEFFRSMLMDNRGHGVDNIIDALIGEISP